MPQCQETLDSARATRAATIALMQCRGFLANVSPEAYTRRCSALFGSTIGQHVRHALDHFAAVLSAVDGSVIDYDHRERQTPIEMDVCAAVSRIEHLVGTMDGLSEDRDSAPVRVRVMLDSEGTEAVLGSTLARELAFAAHHALHHHAMITTIAHEQGLPVPQGFGKAPSTRKHEHESIDPEVDGARRLH